MDLYRQQILDHARNPQHWGLLAHPDIRGSEVNTTCGDEITLDLKVEKSQILNSKLNKLNDLITQSTIEAAGFEGSGCIVMLAAADMLAEYLQEKTIHDIMAMPDQEIFDFFGGTVTPSRQTCALLPLIALKKGIVEADQRPHYEGSAIGEIKK